MLAVSMQENSRETIMALQSVETRARGTISFKKRLQDKDELLEEHPQLLPRIPNEISVNLAAKFLSWKDICVLSSVSRGWCHAIRSHEVYEARVRSQTTEVLPVHMNICIRVLGDKYTFDLSSNPCYYPPPIPDFNRYPCGSGFAALDGRIFIMGGEAKSGDLHFSDAVYMLDLAGQKQWKPCANMKEARGDFVCSVLHGKIYVFGGVQYRKPVHVSTFEPVFGAEVYDPKENTWKSITASPNLRFFHSISRIGLEFVMFGGIFCPSNEWGKVGRRHLTETATFSDAYHVGNDNWRVFSRSESDLADWNRVHEVGADGHTHMTRPHRLSV